MRRKVVLMHLGVTSTLVGGLALLYRFADTSPRKTLYHTVHVTALMGIVTFCYYMLFGFLRQIAPQRWGLGRRYAGQAYSAIDGQQEPTRTHAVPVEPEDQESQAAAAAPLLTQLRIPQRPRLSLGSVCWLVYGLGFFFFVGVYCLSGQQSVCAYYFCVGLFSLCLDELSQPLTSAPFAGRVRVLETLAVVLAFASVALCGVGSILYTLWLPRIDLFSLMSGLGMPVLSAVTLFGLKDSYAHYTNDMLELCEFGLPFMFILSSGFVVVANAQSVWLVNSMNMTSIDAALIDMGGLADGGGGGGLAALLLIGPLLAMPALLFITTAALRGHAADSLLAFALVLVCKYLLEQGVLALGDPFGLSALAAVKLALIARLSSTSEALNRAPPDDKGDALEAGPPESARDLAPDR